MENRPKSTPKIPQLQKSRQKFKNLNLEYNELQSKYDIYKNGTPNNYKQDIQSLKAYNVKNNIKTLELPSIDYLLQEIKNIPENSGTNMRDYNIHPSMLQKYGNKFKNMVSDQQEMKDFMAWFSGKQKQILDRKDQINSKFYLYQNLIASGFNQIITQLSSISRPRSQILKTLWNKQNNQFEKIINLLHKQTSDLQKSNLQTIRSLHIGYQEQIIEIKNQNYNILKKNEQANILNDSCINTLRTMRKQIKKYEKVIKQLNESNYYLKQQSLKLLQQNINLLMKEKNISFQQARVFSYQKLHLSTMKKQLKRNHNTNNIFKDIKNKAEYLVDNSEFHDIEEKKQRLLKFIRNRLKDNPAQKMYILKGQFSEEQDQEIKLQENIQQMLKSKEYNQEIQSKMSKNKAAFFKQVAINTQCQQKPKLHNELHSIGVQTTEKFDKQIVDFITLNKKQEQEDKKKLRDKKVLQRHSLMMIEINKMMEFKKIDNANKIRRLSRFSNIDHSRSNSNDYNLNLNNDQQVRSSLNDSKMNISQQCSGLQIQQLSAGGAKQIQIQKLEQIWEVKNNRQQNIKKRHHQSLLAHKSAQFQSMINRLSRDMSENEKQSSKKSSNFKQENLQQEQLQQQDQVIKSRLVSTYSYPQKQKNNLTKHSKFKQMYRNTNEQQKVEEFKDLVRKFIQKKGQNKEQINNPQKHLKKILTDTFKNLYVSKKTNFIKQFIKTSKNCYGKIVYQNKLIHLISMIIQNKQKSLLSALTLLLNICGFEQNFIQVNNQDANQLYFKIYFTLSLKNPTQNQFNIWNNYTNIQKLSNQTFMEILKTYFHDNKCVYLQLKIRQFIGFSSKDQIDSNYYVQLNPLMMYIIQVYLSEKKNYYESYHQIIDFLSEGDHIELQTFVFVLDLLCFKEQEQRELISQYFDNKNDRDEVSNAHCHKDVFYRICVKYQVPLFQFIKILKLQQFKKLHDYIQNDYIDINDSVKWLRLKENLQKRLKSKNKLGISLRKVIQKLDNYIKGSYKVQNQPFLFFYRIIIFIAFGEI